jgi:hypothetical protein
MQTISFFILDEYKRTRLDTLATVQEWDRSYRLLIRIGFLEWVGN